MAFLVREEVHFEGKKAPRARKLVNLGDLREQQEDGDNKEVRTKIG